LSVGNVQLAKLAEAGVPKIAPLPSVATPVTPKVVLNVPDVNAPVLAVFAPIGTPSIPELIAPESLVFVAKKERLAE
jgi:hypothetical protein